MWPFLKLLDAGDAAWSAAVQEARDAFREADAVLPAVPEHHGDAAPNVRYEYEHVPCRTPPALVALPPECEGRMYIGGLSHAVHQGWLFWAGVTHVVCCLGAFGKEGAHAEHAVAHQARRQGGPITYQDWCVNHGKDRALRQQRQGKCMCLLDCAGKY